MILHTINKPSALEKCRNLIQETDRVVLLEDGVTLALNDLPFHAVAIKTDVQARGLTTRLGNTDLISYGQFVELTESADKVIAWY